MIKLVQIHQIWNLPKIKNMFMSKVHGSLRLKSFDDAIEFRNWNHSIWCTAHKVPNFTNLNSQIWAEMQFRPIQPTRVVKMKLKVQKASSWCYEWNPQNNLHQ